MTTDTPRRSVLRRAGRVCAGVLGVILVLSGLRLMATVGVDHLARAAMSEGDDVTATRLFRSNRVVNLAEPWLAHYDSGVAQARQGHWSEAEADYRRALPLAPRTQRCRVVLNLALTLESHGDARRGSGDPVGAVKTWQEAEAVLRGSSCVSTARQQQKSSSSATPKASGGSGSNRNRGKDRESVQRRLSSKVAAARSGGEPKGTSQDRGSAGGQAGGREANLQQRNEAARSQARQIQDGAGTSRVGSHRDPTTKNW